MRSIKELMNLSGRTALITGGAGHLGSAMASALAEQGASVALVDLDGVRCRATAEWIRETWGAAAWSESLDLADTKALGELPGRAVAALGSLDILVHSAAMVGTSALQGWVTPFEEQSVDTWRKALEVNLTSVFALTQAAVPYLKKSGRGSVINVGSIYGMVGPDWSLYEGTASGNSAAYAASKGGLLQLTRWLATTLAPAVRVNAISPGGVYRNHTDPFLSRYLDHTPMGRMAAEEDLKGAAVYLASDLSAYVTGHNLVVDGGWTAW